ncbi:MAG: hypothetical protein RLZZ628_3131 [Bacteroidota bacterium]|jgi:hypothetical protein
MLYPENCQSSAIYHISFNNNQRTMTVIWRVKNYGVSSGIAYHYQIDGNIYERIVDAKSKGGEIGRLIRQKRIIHFEVESV